MTDPRGWFRVVLTQLPAWVGFLLAAGFIGILSVVAGVLAYREAHLTSEMSAPPPRFEDD